MATGGDQEQQLTNRQIVRLAAGISANNMAAIAEGYMNIDEATIKNKKYENKDDAQAFNREIIKIWIYKNSGDCVKKLADLLFEAAAECGCVDPKKVEEILGVSKEETAISEKPVQVTEEELLTLADELRPYTEKAMKLEPAPWIKDYLVDMDDLYTELTLEKIDNKPYEEMRFKLENYKELFAWHNPGMLEYFNIMYYLPDWHPTRKILIKGDPGIGKTSLVKKIAWDWAKRLFVKVSIVFFVFLKLLKPGDAIENVIVKQTPALQGLHVTKEKIASILECFGNKCLIIFDGLDESASGLNKDVLKIVKDAKWLHSNVIVTSRPHCSKQIEGYCDTVVSVEGFTRIEARKFTSRIVLDQEKVEQILDFNTNRLNERKCLQNVPILLSFLCVLVREDGMDLSDSSISLGEIYWRMFICLYKKFTFRKGIIFDMSSFVEVLRSLGKLALDTLFRAPFFQRSQVIKEVGSDVFDYGLLIGHEDFRLIRDETADILVTFPHRSLQEFLGAFYFVLTLKKEADMHRFADATKAFMTNPLFHQFCLWLLDCRQLSEICPSWNRQQVYELLANHAAVQINHVKIHWKVVMTRIPTFGVALKEQNQKALAMLYAILSKCDKVRHLGIKPEHPVGKILTSQCPLFKSLRSIQVSKIMNNLDVKDRIDQKYRKEIGSGVIELDDGHINADSDLNVIVKAQTDVSDMSALLAIYKACEQWKRSPVVYINLLDQTKGQFELSELLNGTTKGLHLFDRWKVVCHQEIQCCPMLTHLSLNGLYFEDNLRGLSEALRNSKFPQLSHLSLGNCTIGTNGSLSSLFQSQCSSLKHLNLSSFNLENDDLHFLHWVMTDNFLLPNLSSLVLDTRTLEKESSLSTMFRNPWNKLIELSLEDYFPSKGYSNLGELISVINESKLPNLIALHLEGVAGNLDKLHEQKMPHLRSLTLRSFVTPSSILVKSLVKKLPTWKLEKLDISYNKDVRGNLHILVSDILPSLRSLIVIDCKLGRDDLRSLGDANEVFRLPELKYLDISSNAGIAANLSSLLSAEFRTLEGLIVRNCGLNEDDLRSLARANAAGKLPELRHLDISGNDLKGSSKLLTRDPETDRPLSWRSVTCDDVYFSADDEYLSNDDELW